MPIGIYIIPFTRVPKRGANLADRDCDLLITAPTLKTWAGLEIRGNRLIVKVNASASVLTQLDAAYKRLPKDTLNSSLADLSPAVKQALKDELQDQGYTLAEINARFPGDLGDYTLKQVLRFMASRVFLPNYDEPTDSIVFTGAEMNYENDLDTIDLAVT